MGRTVADAKLTRHVFLFLPPSGVIWHDVTLHIPFNNRKKTAVHKTRIRSTVKYFILFDHQLWTEICSYRITSTGLWTNMRQRDCNRPYRRHMSTYVTRRVFCKESCPNYYTTRWGNDIFNPRDWILALYNFTKEFPLNPQFLLNSCVIHSSKFYPVSSYCIISSLVRQRMKRVHYI